MNDYRYRIYFNDRGTVHLYPLNDYSKTLCIIDKHRVPVHFFIVNLGVITCYV
jgi:hypothetical protein